MAGFLGKDVESENLGQTTQTTPKFPRFVVILTVKTGQEWWLCHQFLGAKGGDGGMV